MMPFVRRTLFLFEKKRRMHVTVAPTIGPSWNQNLCESKIPKSSWILMILISRKIQIKCTNYGRWSMRSKQKFKNQEFEKSRVIANKTSHNEINTRNEFLDWFLATDSKKKKSNDNKRWNPSHHIKGEYFSSSIMDCHTCDWFQTTHFLIKK